MTIVTDCTAWRHALLAPYNHIASAPCSLTATQLFCLVQSAVRMKMYGLAYITFNSLLPGHGLVTDGQVIL